MLNLDLSGNRITGYTKAASAVIGKKRPGNGSTTFKCGAPFPPLADSIVKLKGSVEVRCNQETIYSRTSLNRPTMGPPLIGQLREVVGLGS